MCVRAKGWIAGGIAAGLVTAGVVVGTTASAGTTICQKFGSTRTLGGYVAQNNLWGAETPQCISVSGDGFTLTTSGAARPTNGAPASYPSMLWGCHYGTCTTGFTPVRASDPRFARISTSVEFGYVDAGAYDAAYDIWFDPTPRTDGQNTGAELMIWLNHRGAVQPVGSKVGSVRLAGADWDVWFGNIGWNVISYVRSTASTGLSTAVDAFYADAVRRGYAKDDWYLTSVQAGFEPWSGGEGLTVSSFSAGEGGTAPVTQPPVTQPPVSQPPVSQPPVSQPPVTQPPVTQPPVTQPPASQPPASQPPSSAPPVASAGCRISVKRHEWPGGFVRYVTVTNTSTTAMNGWTLSAELADGQQLTNGWSAAWRQDGRQLTARNLDWNPRLAPGSSVEIGFQGSWTGSDQEPRRWQLDGNPCSTA
jgi:hypothetical protein